MTFKDPVLYVLIVNILALLWAVRSWKKGIREKWMNSVRDAGSELLGAAELVYWDKGAGDGSIKAGFMAKERKLLLLFAHNKAERDEFSQKTEALRHAAEARQVEPYRKEASCFYEAINGRVLKEWRAVKCVI